VFADFRARADVPKVLIANTIKGKGVSFMEHPQALRDGDGTYRLARPDLPDAVVSSRCARPRGCRAHSRTSCAI
jgi:hypothetical protein